VKNFLKYPNNLDGSGGVEFGGVPRTQRAVGDGAFFDAYAFEGQFFYFIDMDNDELRRCDVTLSGEDLGVSLKGILEYASSIVLADGLIFTGAHIFNGRDLSLQWSVLDSLLEMETSDVEDLKKTMSEIAEVGYSDGKFYRVYDKARPELGLLEIDPESRSISRIYIPSSSFVFLNDESIVSQFGHNLARFQRDGYLSWEFGFEFRESYKLERSIGFSVLGEKVLGYSTQGECVVLDTSSGSVIWSFQLRDVIDWEYPEESVVIAGVVTNERVAIFKVRGGAQCIFAVDLSDGALLWLEKEESFTLKIGHCIAGDLLFTKVAGSETYPYALDCYTGETVWSEKSTKRDFAICVASNRHVLYLTTYFDGIAFDWNDPYVSPHRPQ
tara:strand:+ start:185 stop:1336 length:1152 start_codon:yes stop_codon:yes gene_type:complete